MDKEIGSKRQTLWPLVLAWIMLTPTTAPSQVSTTANWEAIFQDSSGKPLGNLAVCPRSGGKSGWTDAEGRYTCAGMRSAGDFENWHHFKVRDTRWAIARCESSVAGQRLQQRLTLVPARTVSGTVRDKQGKPLGGVLLFLQRDTLRLARTRTAKDGSFQFLQLRPSRYRVQVDVEARP